MIAMCWRLPSRTMSAAITSADAKPSPSAAHARSSNQCGAMPANLFGSLRQRRSPLRNRRCVYDPRLAALERPGTREAGMVTTEAGAIGTDIRPFRVDTSADAIDDLRRRIAATRLPEKEPVDDLSQGVQLAAIEALARYWGTEYDFG